MEHVKTDDVVRFGAVTHNPSGGALINADEVPRWRVFEEASDTSILSGLFTQRTGFIGTYRATITASEANGFDPNSFYEIHASGKVNGIVGRAIIKTFVLDDIFNSNLMHIQSGGPAGFNFGLMYDGSGYNDGTAPSSRNQVDGIGASSGGSLNFAISEDNTGGAIKSISFVGSQTNTFADIEAENGTLHIIDDTGNAIDIVYGASVGGGRVASEIVFKGFLTSANDTLNILVYDFVGSDWEVRAILSGQGGTTNITQTISLLAKHTGSDADIGKVFVRFQNTGQTNPQLNVDELLIEAVSIGQSVGYANGQIWINTNVSNTNTESFVDGVADNPVSTIAAAKTIATAVGLSDFHVINGSTIVLGETTDGESYFGDNWTLDLSDESCGGAHFAGSTISGTQLGTGMGVLGGEASNIVLGDDAHFDEVGLGGTISLPVGSVEFFNCHHDGVSLPILDFKVGSGNTTVHMHHYNGGIELQNFGDTGTDILHLDGNGRLDLNANCDGGTVNLKGHWTVNDSSGGNVSIIYDDITIDANQISTIPSGVWNQVRSEHTVADSFGEYVDANVVKVSGHDLVTNTLTSFHAPPSGISNAVWNDDITNYTANNTFGSGINRLLEDIYFANIKFLKDRITPRDEYAITWYKNASLVQSGDITDPALSVFKTDDGTSLFANQSLNYASNTLGILRHDEASNVTVSGEPYIVYTSGIIDSVNREWKLAIGIDLL